MSEPQLISPLLDGFVMGDPISNHDGVRACPAMQLETDTRYIVKIISLPSSQTKLYALLLAGAFSSRDAAQVYYKELSDDVLAEAALLQKLSRHEGFVSFDNWQLSTMEGNDIGYDIYLLGKYRPTLEGVLRQNEMTHLQAINLGLDLCAALSVSRRFGYLYCNLRPSNVYICNEREFRIGDLGFISLDSLQYASLPDKYHSDYTPLEITDAYSALNTTLDTYAVGLILYQVYNDGLLPAVGATLSAPAHADPDLSEIILKACAQDPADRWQDPVQLGQALVSYMQSHTVNDDPIVPPPAIEDIPEPEPVFPDEDTEPSTEDILAEVDEALDNAPPLIAPSVAEESIEEEPVEEEPAEEEPVEEEPAEEEPVEEEPVEEEPVEEKPVEEEPVEEEPVEEEPVEEEPVEEEPVEEEPVEEVLEDDGPDEETLQILAQVDELIAHELPESPVAPEPFEVTLPELEAVVEEEDDVSSEETTEDEVNEPSEPVEQDDSDDSEEEELPKPIEKPEYLKHTHRTHKKHHKKLLTIVSVVTVLLLLCVFAVSFYQNYYIKTIHGMVLDGADDTLSVTLMTDTADELLSVICTDTHGNSLTANVIGGVANFSGLKPGITYTVEARISGFHKLVGKTEQNYTAPSQTTVSGFYAIPGPEDGSVFLSFAVQGTDAEKWTVSYRTEGQEAVNVPCFGHTVTLTGLTPGKEYTFTLQASQELSVIGESTIKFTLPEATSTIQNVQFDASSLKELKLSWDVTGKMPSGDWIISYTVDNIQQNDITCTGTSATIAPLIPGASYKFRIRSASGVAVAGGDSIEYQSDDAPEFDVSSVTTGDTVFKMSSRLQSAVNNKTEFDAIQEQTTFTVGERTTITLRLKQPPIAREGSVVILYAISGADGNLVSYKTETCEWSQMWHMTRYHFFSPDMPQEAGNYNVSIYFDGAQIITQDFTVTA